MEPRREESARSAGGSSGGESWLPEPEQRSQPNTRTAVETYAPPPPPGGPRGPGGVTAPPAGPGGSYPASSTGGVAPYVKQRKRWPSFFVGLILGLLVGFFALIIVAIAVSQNPVFVSGPGVDDPDLWVSISSDYLNDVVQQRIADTPIELPIGRVTAVQIGLADNNAGMTLTPTFDLELFTLSPSVDNQLTIENGEITAEMIGEPRIGELSIPLDALPFDLGQVIRDGVNDVNRDVLMFELNQSFQAGFGSDDFDIVQVNTTGDFLVVKLKRE